MSEPKATKELRERLRGFGEQRELMKRAGFFRDKPGESQTAQAPKQEVDEVPK